MKTINDLLTGVLGAALLYLLNDTRDWLYGYLFLALAFITGISLVLRRA